MSDRHPKLRLDEILVRRGLVTEEQVKEALEYQREHGGKVGSHLVRFGYVDERGLLSALAQQFGCETVELSAIEIPEIITRFVPSRVARARMIVPFDYDLEKDVLKVACLNPNDENLRDELKFITRGKDIALFIAAEKSLRDAIDQYYPARLPADIDIDESDSVQPDRAAAQTVHNNEWTHIPQYGHVLIITNDSQADAPLRQALELEEFKVCEVASADDAIELIGDDRFEAVFIRDTVPGDYIDLIDRLRKHSPSTLVHYYESLSDVFVRETAMGDTVDLLEKNLDLFTSLLASKEKLQSNHSAKVGHYTSRLCQRLGLPEKDRVGITTAAYLHDFARYYYGNLEEPDYERQLVGLSAKLLDSLNYSPLVVGVLRAMYRDLGNKFQKRLPIEALGGNIVTAVDLFCESMPLHERVSLDRFEKIRTKFEDLVGKLFMKEVVDAFLKMIQDEILSVQNVEQYSQTMIFCDEDEVIESIEPKLHKEGFHVLVQRTADHYLELFSRSRPDIQILINNREPQRIAELVKRMLDRGVDFNRIPTFLVTARERIGQLTDYLEQGIEDIIPVDDDFGMLIVKMKKIRSRLKAESTYKLRLSDGGGTRGSLEDMNVIDLLQALGPGQRTAKLTVNCEGQQLVIFLELGQIVFAKCDRKEGAEAVYEGISWTFGNWSIEPVDAGELPNPNNDLPNESILMEGCRRVDEQKRADATGPINVG
jgi:DNA-binding response OmpR family regulator